MTDENANVWVGILGFVVVALVIAIVAILCVRPDSTVVPEYRLGDNMMAIENIHDFQKPVTYGDYLESTSLELENSPVSPAAGY